MASVELEPTTDLAPDFSDRIIDTFISFLREVFRHMPDFRFDENDNLTQIMIYDKFARGLDAVGKKPALITDLKAITKGDAVIDDLHGVAHPDFFTKGSKYKTDLFRTIMIIHSMSSVQAESRRLAYLVGFSIFGLEEEFFSRGIFELSVPTPIGEPRKLVTSSQGEIWSTPTTVQISFQESWVTSMVNEDILKKFAIKVTSPTIPNPDC